MFSWLFSSPLPVGSPAPPFLLLDQQGAEFDLHQHRHHNVVLIFYPGDETPICRRQLCEVRDRWDLLAARGVTALGINPQSASSHTRFRQNHGLPFPLLVDSGQRVAKLYRANGPIVRRTVYLIGRSGLIRYARRGRPSIEEVLAAAEE